MTARDIAISAMLWVGLFALALLYIAGMQAAGIIHDTRDWTGSGSIEEFICTAVLCLICGIMIGRFAPGAPRDAIALLFHIGLGEITAVLLFRSLDWHAVLFALIFCVTTWLGGWFGVRTRSPPLP